MARPHWAADLHYWDYPKHITREMLDKVYSDYGMSFETKSAAQAFADKHPGSIMTRLVDYFSSQLDGRGTPLPGAKPREIGWQVTLPRSWGNRNSTKVLSLERMRRAS